MLPSPDSRPDIAAIRAQYASGAFTPGKLVDRILQRIWEHADPAIFIHPLSRERLSAEAAASAGGHALRGATFAIKDNIDLEGVPTTAACPEFAYTPAASAAVVQRLVAAGGDPAALHSDIRPY